jgi:hyaluronoglucosaminidase
MREFAQLVERGGAGGVVAGFALSPGLSIEYASREDRALLVAKVRAFAALGSRFLALLLDDVPSRLVHEADRRRFQSLADAHADLTAELRAALAPEVVLAICPTDYIGVESTDYLAELGARLDPEIEIGWTGRTVVAPEIRADEAARRAAVLRRPLLVWDNVPVADGPMRNVLHLGPYGRREAGIVRSVRGVLLNPMQHAHASMVAVHTAAQFLADPEGYDAERAWGIALDTAGAGACDAFRTFAQAHRFSAIWPEHRDSELEAAFRALSAACDRGADASVPLAGVRALLDVRAQAAPRLRADLADRALAAEIEPWLASHERETRRMRAATDALTALAGEGPLAERTLAYLRFEGRLSRERESAPASYGPRRALYPQLASLRDEGMRFGPDPALFRDRCLADDFVALVERVARRDLALW